MPRILAIDWDRHEVRGLLLQSGATGTSVAGAWAASLATADPAGLSGAQIGTRLAAAMSEKITGKVTTIVGVGRDNMQIKLMSLPPAPADDLAQMVRFQAEREFTALGDDAALDFIPLSGDVRTPHQVLAVALSAAGMTEAREVCQSLGVEPDRIPLRACAAATLVYRAGMVSADKVALIVNPLTDEADLSAQAGDQVVLLRTVRLPEPSQAEARQRALVGEIRRTVAAVRQQLADRPVDRVIVCGNQASEDLGGSFAEEIELPVTMFDPAAHAPSGFEKHGVAAESLARFAALLGMALGEADRRPSIVDFAHVRRPAEARRFGRVHALAVAAAAVAGLWYGAYLWRQLAQPARELAELQARLQGLQAQAKQYEAVSKQAAAVERWLATDVNWLDELEQFARRVRPQPLSAKDYPIDDDVVVTQLTLLRPPDSERAAGRMDLEAVAKSAAAVNELEQRLRDHQHRVTTGSGKQDSTIPGYGWSLALKVHVSLPSEEGTEATLTTPPPAPAETQVAPKEAEANP